MEEEQKKSIDKPSDTSSSLIKEDTDPESSNSPKKQKKNEHYQDISFTDKNNSYCSFSSINKKHSELKPIQELLNQIPIDQDDDQREKIAAAKKLLFPDALATSFPEVVDTLRNERRQEFSPIYKDETPEQIALRQSKQKKPIGSLLAKRIRWDDLKRKREEEEKKAQMQFRYGPYGPVYNNQQSQQSFANPYEQYYTAMHHQYEQVYSLFTLPLYYSLLFFQMIQMTRTQQEHSGFWPEYQQQPTFQNNDHITQNSMQQTQPYTYPYPAMYSNTMNTSSYSAANYNAYLNSIMQPPPPPPDEPYPY